MRSRKRVLGIVFAALAGIVILAASAFSSWILQLNNSLTMKQHAANIEKIRARDGTLPLEYPCNDIWGHKALYLRSGDRYVLVSFGLFGKADVVDYSLALEPEYGRRMNCLAPNEDTVVVDNAMKRFCLE